MCRKLQIWYKSETNDWKWCWSAVHAIWLVHLYSVQYLGSTLSKSWIGNDVYQGLSNFNLKKIITLIYHNKKHIKQKPERLTPYPYILLLPVNSLTIFCILFIRTLYRGLWTGNISKTCLKVNLCCIMHMNKILDV